MITKPQLSVPDFLLEIARGILAENTQPEKARCEPSVTLRRRLRGATPSDNLGRFSPLIPDTWVGDGPEQEKIMNMYSFQVVEPIVKANQAAMAQAEVECTVKPADPKNPKVAGVASIGTGIYNFFNGHPDYWSNNIKNQIAQQCQTDPGYFFHTYHDPDAESLINIAIDEYSDQPVEQPGEYACAHCGAGGPMFSEQMGQAANGQMPCLGDGCDQMAEILGMPEAEEVPFHANKTEYPAGNTIMDVVSAFQIRIDERKTKNGQVRKAEWLEHHYLMFDDDLQAMVPWFDIGPPGEWSYPIRWEFALETGTTLYLKPWASDGMGERRPQHEVRKIYMRPGRYRHYRAPADFTLDRGDGYAAVDRQGKPMLSIKAGQRLVDLFPKGFWFVVSNEQLLPIVEPCDLRDEWAYGGYVNDSASFWYRPATSLNELARAANFLWTVQMQHLETSSIVTTHYDREWWDSDDFERGLSPTKEGVHIAPGDDISRHFKTTTPPQLNGVMEGMNFIRSLAPDVSGVQPAMVGAPTGDETFSAQQLQKQQSLGLLTPAQQSMAACKAMVVMQFLKFSQRTRPIEWFQYIGTVNGQEWKQQDIEAFLNSNLELDLVVGYKEGSEIPTSLIEQEMKLRQIFVDVTQAAQYIPGLLKPEMVNEMVSKLAETSGLDFDFNDVEADQRLAFSRYQHIKLWLETNKNEGMPEALLVDLALSDRSLKPAPGEISETHIEFWQDNMRALMDAATNGDANYPLISCCVKMIDRHREAIKAEKQSESEIEVEGHAPEIAAQAAAQQAAAQAEAQAQAEKDQREAAARAQDNQAAIERQAMAEEAKARKSAADRALKERIHADDVALRAAEIAKPESSTTSETPDEPIDPIQSIAESIDYNELPISAQKSMLDKVGLPSSGVKDANTATIQRAQISATKARASQTRSNTGARK